MFGLSFSSCELIQGPAVRTWNCVAHFANLLWYKFYHTRQSVMPRSRRRHHSRSRTRSRSHSCDRDREPKRRKIESFESPHKRSYSPHSENEDAKTTETSMDIQDVSDSSPELDSSSSKQIENKELESDAKPKCDETAITKSGTELSKQVEKVESALDNAENGKTTECEENERLEPYSSSTSSDESDDDKDNTADKSCDFNTSAKDSDGDDDSKKKTLTHKMASSMVTPKKVLSPKQVQKRMESEKKREEQRQEREKLKQEKLEQKLREKQEKQKQKEAKEQQKLKEKREKQEQKQKELQEKQKEKELKEEQKKKEREEKEREKEQKRKEKEEKVEQKRKEQEEKNKEKQKEEEKKQKAAAVFANFFMKKADTSISEDNKLDDNSLTFMPFEVKSDMRLAPLCRRHLINEELEKLDAFLIKQSDENYLKELRSGKQLGQSAKTWPAEDPDSDDVVIIEENPGEAIEEQQKNSNKMHAKLLKFQDNRRPAYFGTWRKKSKFIKPRKPLALDTEHFDYDVNSDDDWEEGEDAGESLHGSDDEDKENESDEYEVDDDFFVPHGHLSDDEVNDEDEVVSPEAHKAKLKLLKKEFEEEIKAKTQKIKPRVIGCIWYNKDGSNVDSAIREFLKPLAMICNGQVKIKKRSEFMLQTPSRKPAQIKMLNVEFMPDFLNCIHGNTKSRKKLVEEFLENMQSKNISIDLSRSSLSKQVKLVADWAKCQEDGPMRNKFCWVVRDDVKSEYNVDLSVVNKL